MVYGLCIPKGFITTLSQDPASSTRRVRDDVLGWLDLPRDNEITLSLCGAAGGWWLAPHPETIAIVSSGTCQI